MANGKLWVNFCKAVGREEWLADPRFETNPKRVENREAILPLVAESGSTVLQEREAGTVKDLLARAIHNAIRYAASYAASGVIQRIGDKILEVFEKPRLKGEN